LVSLWQERVALAGMKRCRQFAQTAPPKTSLQGKLILLGATAGGIGYAPILPGTVGTVAAIPFSFGLNRFAEVSVLGATIVLLLTILSAMALATKAAELLQQKDPGIIVIDEIVGFLVGNFSAPMTVSALLASFLLFRFFDIAKVFPASRLEWLPGGAGIVLDDIMAGIYTFVLVQLLLTWGIV
jgi:phosphatidylglycerophosphatase A